MGFKRLPEGMQAEVVSVGPKAKLPEATDEPPRRERAAQINPAPAADEAGARTPLRLTLPWPPSCNHHWRYADQHVRLSEEGRKYRHAVADAINARGTPSRMRGRIGVSITLHPPDQRRFDIDNRIKPLLDALQRCLVIDDDEAVDELTCRRGEPRPGGEVEVVLWEAGRPDAPPPPRSETG